MATEPVVGDETAPAVPLPEPVRRRVIALAADRLSALQPDEMPAELRRIARFAPAKRARLAAAPLAAALESDAHFRSRVAEGVRGTMPGVVAAVEAGTDVAAAPPEDVAAVAYLLRPAGWQSYLARVGTALQRRDEEARSSAHSDALMRMREQLEAARATGRTEIERLRADLTAARSESDTLRRDLREATERARRAERAAGAAAETARSDRTAGEGAVSVAEAETRRVRARLAEAESVAESGRRAARRGRVADEVRLRVLLDALLGAAQGLRRELALPPAADRPADSVADALQDSGEVISPLASVGSRGLEDTDPAVLDALLAVPAVHLVVDGYNVTKTGYGSMSLEAQRSRLAAGLAAVAAQTGAEVTCVFDGAERPAAALPPPPRGVRVLFSDPGETADELIRRLVRAEPPGRPVVVVSSDREVADGVRTAGARPLPASALLRRLGRG